MGRVKWFLAAFVVILGASRILAAPPSAQPTAATALMSAQLPPLWHGLLCLIAGRHEQTIAICDEVLRVNPNDPRAYAVRGYAHLLTRGNPRQAIADFSQARRHDPDNDMIYVARAQAFEQTKEYDRTIADCTEATCLAPRNWLAFATRAECYAWKKVTGKAVADYTAALRINPELTWVRARRASIYFEQREWARALADFDELLRCNPDDREIKNARCLAYLFIYRDFNRAFTEASELVHLDPVEARWYWLRCAAYVAKGEYVPGCCDAIVALILNPRAIKAWIGSHSCGAVIGPSWAPNFTYVKGDQPEKRIEDCTKRLASDPNNLAAYYERAYVYLTKRDFKRAAPDLDEIIRRDPLDAVAYRLRGSLRYEIRSYTNALDDYTKSIRLDPDNADGYAWRARAYGKLEKYEEALRDCAEALRLDPRSGATYSVRGWVYDSCKLYERAIADYSEAIRLSPLDPNLYLRRADARCCLWDCAGAIADFKQAVRLQPENHYACSRLAACLCCCPDASLRDGKAARKLATAVCKATSWRVWQYLDILALACAECSHFDEAVKWQTKAAELAPDSERLYNQERLELYRTHRTYHATLPQGVSLPPSPK